MTRTPQPQDSAGPAPCRIEFLSLLLTGAFPLRALDLIFDRMERPA